MVRAGLVSLLAALALPQTLVSAGDHDDDGYFSLFAAGPVLEDSLPGSGAKVEAPEAAKEAKKPLVAPEDVHSFGPTTQLTAKPADPGAVNPKAALPAKAVQELVGAVQEMHAEMRDATSAIKKLNARIFSDDEGTQAPVAVAEAEAPPVKFVAEAEAEAPRDEEGRLPEMTRFLAHRKSAEALKAAAEAGRENMAMHRAEAGLDGELRGGLHHGSGMHASKLQRIKRERSAKHHDEEAEHEEAVTTEARRQEAVAAAKLEARGEAKQVHEHHEKHHKKHHEKARVEVQEEAVADVQDEQSTDAQVESESQDQSDAASQDDVASQDNAEGDSAQGADAQQGEDNVDDASQEAAAEDGDAQQQQQQQDSGAEGQDADVSQDEGSAQSSDEQGQDSPTQATQAEAQGQEATAPWPRRLDAQEADDQAQDDDERDNSEYEAALIQASPKVRGSRHRAMLLQQQSDSTRVSAEVPEPTVEYDMSDAFQAEQKHKADLALN